MHPILFYPLFLVVVPLLMLEGICRLLPVTDPPPLMPVTAAAPVVRLQPNRDYRFSAGWNFSIVTRKRSNNFGYNFVSDYDPQETAPLLAVIGDSFVEALTVDAGKSAAEVLDSKVAGKGRVYSLGVSGAPLSQYLVFADFARTTFRPDAMAFFIISNDFDESLLKYNAEPRFHYFEDKATGAQLRRVDYALPPAKEILRKSAFVRYVVLNVRVGRSLERMRKAFSGRASAPYLLAQDLMPPATLAQRIRDSKQAVDHFLDQLPARSGLPSAAIVFIMDAMRPAIYSEEWLRLAENGYHAQMRRYFEAAATARGYQVVDLQPVFIARHRRDGARFELPTDSHWNELGNRLVADELEKTAAFKRVFGARALPQARAVPGR